jgi:hypothetical protein
MLLCLSKLNNSDPIGDDSNETECGKEVSGELVIARCDAAKVPEPSKAALDDVAFFIRLFVMPDALLAIGFTRDDRFDFLAFEEGAKRIRVVALVGQKLLDAGDQADAFLRHGAVGGVARREDQYPRAEKLINDRVDFAVAAALGEPDRLKFGPPFPPLAQR